MTQDELNAGIDFLDVHFKFIENTDEMQVSNMIR